MDLPVKSAVRTRRTQQQIRALIEEFSKSGLTVKEFCLSHNINQGNFHKWKARFKSRKGQQSSNSAFASMKILPGSSTTLFAEVNGIRIFQPVAAAYLKELLA